MNVRRQIVGWLPAFLYAFLIFYLPTIPWLHGAEHIISLPDSVKHVVQYAILSFLLFRAFRYSGSTPLKTNAYLLAITLSILIGIVDEFHQLSIPRRQFSGFDILSDAIGSCLILILKPRKLE